MGRKKAIEGGKTSKYAGVSLQLKHMGQAAKMRHSMAKPWHAMIRLDGGGYWQQTFATEREAAIAYDRYVLEHRLDRPLNILKPKVAE